MNITNPEKIKALLETPEFLSIRSSEEFYFQKGQNKLQEWLDLDVSDKIKTELFSLSKNYKEFKKVCEAREDLKPIAELLYIIIAYCDSRAKHKDIFNQYDDKRAIARAGIYMNIWIKHLLEYKFNPEKLPHGNTLNSFKYLLEPATEINVVSEAHRSQIAKNVLKKVYVRNTFVSDIVSFFAIDDFNLKNEFNKTHLITRLLYEHKTEWLIAEENPIERDLADILQASVGITEKETLILARIGQGKYRKELIEIWKGCAISGYYETSLLVASHIKPWSHCSNKKEKVDHYNGLLLLPNYDKLFDRGLISFDEDGLILISNSLCDPEVFGIDDAIKINLKKRNKKYMRYHREQVFKG